MNKVYRVYAKVEWSVKMTGMLGILGTGVTNVNVRKSYVIFTGAVTFNNLYLAVE